MLRELNYNAVNMRDCLNDLSKNFKLPDEIACEPHYGGKESFPVPVAENGMDEERFAAALTSRQVEELLRRIVKDRSGEYPEILSRSLAARMSKRIIALVWAYFAYDYQNEGMENAVSIAVRYAEQRGIDTLQAKMLRMAKTGRLPDVFAQSALSSGLSLKNYFISIELSQESPLAAAVAKSVLLGCGKETLLLNEDWLLRLIVTGDADTALLKNYIGSLSENEYSVKVNIGILEHIGFPHSPGEWPSFPEELRLKFIRWRFLWELQKFYPHGGVKQRYFVMYLNYFKDVKVTENTVGESVLIADFGSFVVVDENNTTDYAFLYEKSAYKRLWDDNGAAAGESNTFDARDFILSHIENDVIRLNFYRFGKLYVKDMLDILLEIVPDTRD